MIEYLVRSSIWLPRSQRMKNKDNAPDLFNYDTENGVLSQKFRLRPDKSSHSFYFKFNPIENGHKDHILAIQSTQSDSSDAYLAFLKDCGSSGKALPLNDSLWLVVREFGSPLHAERRLHKGDELRFGRVRYEVLHIGRDSKPPAVEEHLGDSGGSTPSTPRRDIGGGPPLADYSAGSRPCCRICLEGEAKQGKDEPANPFLNLCDCRGDLSVHLSCIKEWLTEQSTRSPTGQKHTRWNAEYHCELCGVRYPDFLEPEHFLYPSIHHPRHEGKRLFECPVPPAPYIALKCLITGSIEFIGLSQDGSPSFVGRNATSALHIDEESISRKHAMIRINQKDEMILEDCGSKYGTTVKIFPDSGFTIAAEPVWFQLRNCVFMVERTKKKGLSIGRSGVKELMK